MKHEELEHRKRLCRKIEMEKDQKRFLQLVQELNDLLEGKAHRLKPRPLSNPEAKASC
jgi:hypothetical protein